MSNLDFIRKILKISMDIDNLFENGDTYGAKHLNQDLWDIIEDRLEYESE